MTMVLKKMRVPQLLDDWETKNNVFILNVPMSDQRLKRLQKQAKKIADFDSIDNKKSTFFMNHVVNPNLPPIRPSSMERKIINLLAEGTRVVDVARKIGMTVRRVSRFKNKNSIIEFRCYFFDSDGWMKFKCDNLNELYAYLADNGIAKEPRTTFFRKLDDADGVIYQDNHPIGRVDTMKLVRRTI